MASPTAITDPDEEEFTERRRKRNNSSDEVGLGAFAASELDKVFSGYQPR
jgi:hypothetical protein